MTTVADALAAHEQARAEHRNSPMSATTRAIAKDAAAELRYQRWVARGGPTNAVAYETAAKAAELNDPDAEAWPAWAEPKATREFLARWYAEQKKEG